MARLTETVAPSVEPVTRAEAKTHIKSTTTAEDSYIDGLIVAARQWVEAYTGRAYVQRTYQWNFDDFPPGDDDVIKFPVAPVRSISSIQYVDSDGVTQTFPASSYALDNDDYWPAIYLAYNQSWPSDIRDIRNAVTVNFVAGYTESGSPADYSANVPDAVKHAIKILVGHFDQERQGEDIPAGVKSLLMPYKRYSF